MPRQAARRLAKGRVYRAPEALRGRSITLIDGGVLEHRAGRSERTGGRRRAPWPRSMRRGFVATSRRGRGALLRPRRLAGELLALLIDARERLADPLLLFGDLIQCRHSVPSRRS